MRVRNLRRELVSRLQQQAVPFGLELHVLERNRASSIGWFAAIRSAGGPHGPISSAGADAELRRYVVAQEQFSLRANSLAGFVGNERPQGVEILPGEFGVGHESHIGP